MTLRRAKNPRSRPPKALTPAQKVAWQAFRLRGLYHQTNLLTGERRAAAQAAIDAELDRIGHETETDRWARRRREWEAADAAEAEAERSRPAMIEDIPF